ncbi:glutathione binding-like protein [Lichenihabitans sp. Uapishka_5]|uniref:glutathione binding-like protein n=1 Tax=Lichenihabitans sp. Uapishka_5 TaxID=3037302 RepID=UPI0029E7D20B|nr:glutathione binding-like protein [Lichenihabitans sp. Uapishka_5]MDX7953299.1 glutathione binding-like protein [Lichenihabitans sp. Uapishka_5]
MRAGAAATGCRPTVPPCRRAVERAGTVIGDNAFLAGLEPSIADFKAFQTARERCDLAFGQGRPRLNAWYGRVCRRPSAKY